VCAAWVLIDPRTVEAAVGPWGVDDRSEIREGGCYFFAMNVYLPLSSDSLSSQMTVDLPSRVKVNFTAPFPSPREPSVVSRIN
jgi:hypothetical protein